MKISFKFDNGSSQLIITPETARDKTYIDLCIDGRNKIALRPTSTESIIIEFTTNDSLEKPGSNK